MPKFIDNISALIINNDKKILLTWEEKKNLFLFPGGKREDEETDKECLRRELSEELKVNLKSMKLFDTFCDEFKGVPVTMACYFVDFSGEPTPCNEITSLHYIGSEEYKALRDRMPPSLLQAFPKLISEKYIK